MKKIMKWTKMTDVILICLGVLFIAEGVITLFQGGKNIVFYFLFGIFLAIIPVGKRRMDKKQLEELEKSKKM